MTKFSGAIGYGETVESPKGSGVWVDRVIERPYFGDVEYSNRRYERNETVNVNVEVQNSISILADAYANENFMNIRYIQWQGKPWTVSTVEVKPPRILIYMGDIYNGPTA